MSNARTLLQTNLNMRPADRRRLEQEVAFEDHYGGAAGVVPLISRYHPDLPEHKVGVVCEATPAIAARMVFKLTHEEATPEQHARYKQELAARTSEYAQIEFNKRMSQGQFAVLQNPTPATVMQTPTAPQIAILPTDANQQSGEAQATEQSGKRARHDRS